jgi:hypothetical protein
MLPLKGGTLFLLAEILQRLAIIIIYLATWQFHLKISVRSPPALTDSTTDNLLCTVFSRADEALTQEILDLLKQASALKLVKKGYKEGR